MATQVGKAPGEDESGRPHLVPFRVNHGALHLQGYLAILTASVLYAASMVASRYLLRETTPVALAHASSLGIALVLAAGTAVFRPGLLRVRAADLWRFAALGILGFAATGWLLNTALETLNTASVMTLHYTFPALTLLYASWRGVERADAAKVTAVGCTLAGCALTTGLLQGGFVLDPFGVVATLGSACAFAFVTLFSCSFPRPYSPVTTTLYTFVFASLAFFLVSPLPEVVAIVRAPGRNAAFAGYVLFLCVAPNLLLFYGLKRVTPTSAGVICSFEVVATAVLAWLLLNEKMSVPQTGGAALVVAGVVLIELSRRRRVSGADQRTPVT